MGKNKQNNLKPILLGVKPELERYKNDPFVKKKVEKANEFLKQPGVAEQIRGNTGQAIS